MTVPVVYDPRHENHRPRIEILYGRPLPHPEQPERVEAIRHAITGTPFDRGVVSPREYPIDLACLVHERAYLDHLRARGSEAEAEGLDGEWFPYVFARDRSLDMGTPVQRDTIDHAWHSACVALTTADLVHEGANAAYGLCRPPGHHAAAGSTGGYCYFNNAAIAARRLQQRRGEATRVAILDLDIHHGNGTQDIFYRDGGVLYCSIHGDPEWAYPPHTGFPDETGSGPGEGLTFNQVLPVGSDWSAYKAALDRALSRVKRFAPAVVVLSQGFDTFEGDRWGGFLLRAEHFGLIAGRVRSLGVPTMVVLEGGYEPANIAAGSLALLEGMS